MLTSATVRYIGTTGETFTNNTVYTVVAWAGINPVVLGDNYTVQPITIGGQWEFVSVVALTPTQIYP